MIDKINIPEFEVSEFNQAFKEVIESNFNYVRIKGEISEVKTATRGQIYLTLKDEDSILSGVIWDQKKKYLDINPEIGLEIIATGRITTWSRYKTTYQIDIDKIEIAGEVALIKLIEERKRSVFGVKPIPLWRYISSFSIKMKSIAITPREELSAIGAQGC